MFIIIIIIIILFLFIYFKFLRGKPYDSVIMINGDPGAGKSSTGLYIAHSNIKKRRKKTKFKNFIRKKLLKKDDLEMPVTYCNIPLYNMPFKPFTLAHLYREKRFDYKSVVYLNECSLIADSMLALNIGKDEATRLVNDKLKLFCKLIRHELKGSGVCMILDTQNPNDLALGGDRVLSSTYYIMRHIDFIPFIRLVKLREMKINMEGVQNVINNSAEQDTSRWLIVPKSIFKKYDSYCYEFLTRDKPKDEKEYFFKARSKRKLKLLMGKPFYIPTITKYKEIKDSNKRLGFNDSQVDYSNFDLIDYYVEEKKKNNSYDKSLSKEMINKILKEVKEVKEENGKTQ